MLDVHTIQLAVDPLIVINASWPDGRYSLIQATSGCPTGWSSGFVKQDFENAQFNVNFCFTFSVQYVPGFSSYLLY